MNKNIIAKIARLLILPILFLAFAGTSFAASPVSIRLQQPANQTSQNTFDLTFVALDVQGRVVTVQCEKKGPSDAGFVAFGSPITLSAGGNSDNCHVDSSVVNQNAQSYQFEAIATAGLDTATSNIVGLDYNNEGPGTPVNYNKSKPDSCSYKITFKTANDGGKTVKVLLYRSADASFNLDSGTEVNSVNIGSDTDGEMTNNVSPDCDKTYYYALRAFDAYGNASGSIGDSTTQTTTINVTGAPTQGGALIAGEGQVLGGETGAKKEVLGTESAKVTPSVSPAGQNPVSSSVNWVLGHKKISLAVLVILLVGAYYLYRRNKKK
jgi:hypothetical protein